jgi:hypothetical protein
MAIHDHCGRLAPHHRHALLQGAVLEHVPPRGHRLHAELFEEHVTLRMQQTRILVRGKRALLPGQPDLILDLGHQQDAPRTGGGDQQPVIPPGVQPDHSRGSVTAKPVSEKPLAR